MKIEGLNRFKTNVIYKSGYRVIYYYETYHEPLKEVHAENLNDFIDFLDENIKYNGVDDLLRRFLNKNDKALGVAIYDVSQNCIGKLIRDGVKKVNDTTVYKEELIYDYNYVTVNDGYRIVYLYNDGTYKLGVGAKKIEDFMIEFTPYEPIDDSSLIPPFISVEDLLNRFLIDCPNIDGIAIYKVDGTLIEEKFRDRNNVK